MVSLFSPRENYMGYNETKIQKGENKMRNSLYTNTGKVGSVVGLLATTILVTYCATHSTEIVNGAVRIVKDGVELVKSKLHGNKQQYSVWQRDFDGKLYDTGRKVWSK